MGAGRPSLVAALTLAAAPLVGGCGRLHYTAGDDAGRDRPPIDALDADGPEDGSVEGEDSGDAPDDGPAEAGEAPPTPTVLRPWNGEATGSAVAAPAPAGGAPAPLRPRFAWAPVAGADRIELELDDACAGTTYRSCTFPTPIRFDATGDATSFEVPPGSELPVSPSPPVGQRYGVRLRACSADRCSDWSVPRYLDVGRVPCDFNGDGYADLLAGARRYAGTAPSHGAALVYYGGPGGLPATEDALLEGGDTEAGALFGGAVACAGDVNADGYGDALVGAPYADGGTTSAGRVSLFHGGPDGLGDPPETVLRSGAPETLGRFGTSVAGAGDVNADGFADVLVGAPFEDGSEADMGRVYLFFGPAASVSPDGRVELTPPVSSTDATMGAVVSRAGDLNGDGIADLLVTASSFYGPETREGAAFVHYGALSGPSATANVMLDNPIDQTHAAFGYRAWGGEDLDGDGYADVIVGMGGCDRPASNEGCLFGYRGGAAGLETAPWLEREHPDDQAGGRFSSALVAADFDSDGYPDLAVGANEHDTATVDLGAVFLYRGTETGLRAPSVLLNPGAGDEGYAFAASAPGDVDGDGYPELAVGAYRADGAATGEGRVDVYRGSAAGLTGPPAWVLRAAVPRAGADLGWDVAR